MSYQLIITDRATRQLARLPKSDQRRIDRRIVSLTENPRPPGCVKIAGQENLWRVRVGDYRIVYAIDEKGRIVIVSMVGHRRDVYRNLE